MSRRSAPKNFCLLLERGENLQGILAPPAQGDEGYVPLLLRNLAVNRPVPFAVYVRVKTAENPVPHYGVCCPKGEVFQREWQQQLARLEMRLAYFEAGEEETVLGYLTENLHRCHGREHETQAVIADLVFDTTLVGLRHLFTTLPKRGGCPGDVVFPLVERLIHLIEQENYWSLMMGTIRHDQGLFTHSLNVCLFGLGFVRYLGWPAEEALPFGLGALLHDLGMSRVPKRILKKKGPLTEEELAEVHKHPARGFGLLKGTTCLSRETLLMVLQHHENGDGSGYPHRLPLEGIHPWARILRIVDSYEAMTAPRSRRGILSPQEALWTIRGDLMDRQIFDPDYFTAFVKFLSHRRGK